MPRITPQHWRTLEKVFLKAGFTFERESSSHRVYSKPGVNRPIVIPKYKEVAVDIIKSNMRTAELTNKEYFKLLESI
ncbi:MAG: type II toxin-antitoxin system HicA family toxin [Candidatus Zixiibacteriota bacterium]